MELIENTAFIVGAYSVACLIVVGLIVWVVMDYERQRDILSKLEARGITRRSERTAEKQP
jgi:heme exporter protein D